MSTSEAADPVIGAVLSPELAAAIEKRRAEYVSRLIRHDWAYAYSCDYNVFLAGQRERDFLEAERKVIDPDYTLWNRHSPAGRRRAAEAVSDASVSAKDTGATAPAQGVVIEAARASGAVTELLPPDLSDSTREAKWLPAAAVGVVMLVALLSTVLPWGFAK